jgi:hypothetical protein
MYCSCSCTVRARACVLSARICVHSLIFERIMSKFAGNILRLTISGKDYVLFIVTHRMYACKRASASTCVITHSLIYGRIFFKFAVNILQVTSSSMGNVLFMFTHRAHACERTRVRPSAWLNIHLSMDTVKLLQFCNFAAFYVFYIPSLCNNV